MWLKTFILLTAYLGAYALIMVGGTTGVSVWALLGLCVFMGLAKAGIGFSVAHDAIHGAYSPKRWVNRALGLSMNLIGGSDYAWKISHNIVHHTYTNIHHVDPDLEVTTLMRLAPEQPQRPIHKWQHLYFPAIYALASVFWVLVKDWKKLSDPYIGPIKKNHPKNEIGLLIFTKAVYYAYTIIIPLLILDVAWWQFVIGFLTMHFTTGLTMGIIFQLAHVVEDTEYPAPDENRTMEDAWAVHQLRTTANFSRDSKFLNWYVGGLNFQIEHHLFSNICSIHYKKISPIVEAVAKRHNVPYHVAPTFLTAVKSHIAVLKNLGTETQHAPVQMMAAA